MNHIQRNIKFKDRVQVLEFKKNQFVTNLLKGVKKDILLNEGESEYTKKRRQEKEAMKKKSGKSRVPKEYVGIVLARQKEIEAQFWAAYCRRVWARIKRLCQEACYGCSHRMLDESHHVTCQMSDVDCIRRFMEMAMSDVRCFDVMKEWFDALTGLNPPLSENEVLLYDASWVLERMGRPDRIRILRELMVGDAMDVEGSMADEELLEPADDFMTDEELLEAAADAMETQHNNNNNNNNNNTTHQSESTDATQQPDMTFDYVGEFLGPVEEEEGEEPFIPFPNCWGCVNFRPSQNDHECCNYGKYGNMEVLEEEEEEPEEDITDVQEGVCVKFCFLLLLLFSFYLINVFWSPEQLNPSKPIWEWSCPVFFDKDQ